MSIIRSARKERDFAILSNKLLQDTRLTMGALGVLVRLLSRPDNWETNSETLAREFNCGRDAVRTNLKKLQEIGYIKLFKSQDEMGRWSSSWMVFEESEDDPEWDSPADGLPAPGNPVLGKSGALQRTDYKEPIHTISNQNPDCPHQELIDMFVEKVTSLPKPRIWTGKRQKDMLARWKWVIAEKVTNKESAKQEALEFFARFFDYVNESDFLTGRSKAWEKCDLPWLMKEENFAKVIEGNYENKGL